MKHLHLFLLVATTLACTEASLGTAHPELERADVENINEGDAQGSDYAGRYTIVRFDVVRCVCAEGADAFDCDTVELAAEGLAVEQDDGALAAQPVFDGEPHPDIHWAGGVDADGSFRLGGVFDATDDFGDPIGNAIELVEGEFGASGELEALWTSRLQAVFEDSNVDCELSYDIEAALSD
jgi:hypothetical protein